MTQCLGPLPSAVASDRWPWSSKRLRSAIRIILIFQPDREEGADGGDQPNSTSRSLPGTWPNLAMSDEHLGPIEPARSPPSLTAGLDKAVVRLGRGRSCERMGPSTGAVQHRVSRARR